MDIEKYTKKMMSERNKRLRALAEHERELRRQYIDSIKSNESSDKFSMFMQNRDRKIAEKSKEKQEYITHIVAKQEDMGG